MYNHELEAWQKIWPERPEALYLYNQGNECAGITGGWEYKKKTPFGNRVNHGFETKKEIDFSKYQTMNIVISGSKTGGNEIYFYANISGKNFGLIGNTEAVPNPKTTKEIPLTDIDRGLLFAYLDSNAFSHYNPSFSGEKQRDGMKLFSSYNGATTTIYIHEIYLT